MEPPGAKRVRRSPHVVRPGPGHDHAAEDPRVALEQAGWLDMRWMIGYR
jgi:hypothetical protein